MTTEIKKGNCHYCGYLCGFDIHLEQGRVTDVTPDESRYPYDASVAMRCVRWRMNAEKLIDESLINYPLKRVGARGSGEFVRVSWDEAIEDIAKRLNALVDEHGPWTVASAIGGPHAVYWSLHRFMNLLGSPNNMGIGPICWNPRIWMDAMAYGFPIEVDFRPPITGCLILWGTNPAVSDNSLFWSNVAKFAREGGKLVVIDPRLSLTAANATLWLHPFPGTDTVLAYALARVFIEDDLIDHEFVRDWCHGYEQFREAAFSRTLEEAAEITTVSVEDIREAAHLFCDYGAGALLSGRGIDQIGANTVPLHRVIAALRAITGNVDRPGACHIDEAPSFRSELELEMSSRLSDEAKAHGLNEPDCGLLSYAGYAAADEITGKLGKHLPMRYLTSVLPVRVWEAAVNAEPYKVSALIAQAANPMVTYADTDLVKRALESMDLVVVLDSIMTPTGLMADYVLPSAHAFERPNLQAMGGVSDFCYGGPAALEPAFERREDHAILRSIALAMGQSEADWPAETLADELAYMLEPVDMSFEDFASVGICAGNPTYEQHLQSDESGQPRGFGTRSGKVELTNEFLQERGATLVPAYVPLPGIHKDVDPDPHAVVLITGARKQPYWASCYFEVPAMRKRHPKPLLEMSAATAERIGVAEGDKVVITRVDLPKVEVVQYVTITDMVDGVASAEYGWWFPERLETASDFEECLESSINWITRGTVDVAEPLIGTWIYNGIPCRIYRKD